MKKLVIAKATTHHFFSLTAQFTYHVVVSKQLTLRLHIESGEVYVYAPLGVSETQINTFLAKHCEKINFHLHQYASNKKLSLQSKPNDYFVWKGAKLPLKVDKYKSDFLVEGHQILVNKRLLDKEGSGYSTDRLYAAISHYCYAEMVNYVAAIAQEMKQSVPTLKIKSYKSRWGMCHPQTNTITLNVKLMHFPYEVIRAIIVHEIAHLVVPNHSKAFWDLVAVYVPNYKAIRLILKYPGV